MKTLGRVVFGLLRIWLGYQWLEAGLEKLSNPAWVGDKAGVAITGFFNGAIAKATGDHPAVQGWYAAFLKNVALPHATFFSYLVPIGEFLVGMALIFGVLTGFAALVGAFMNLNFMLAGSTSTNPILYTVAIIVALAGARASYFGLDYYVMPIVRRLLDRVRGKEARVGATA
ncbi:DoxX family protein [Carboxydochorda subterranea]|uniref:DoxX family protein n=1 Tax=Carboxydichorda subterranea TaxID=3109565 RepID=A0ABZ1BYQ9_9FIRM|nr:DoxX family protein [Limnochorda sp. L945t]WRP17660.1 DoxX family protein [Limnochorda sp. L945t]